MENKKSKTWTTKTLVNFGVELAGGYVPGVVNRAKATGDQWTTEQHLRAANLLGKGYNPGT